MERLLVQNSFTAPATTPAAPPFILLHRPPHPLLLFTKTISDLMPNGGNKNNGETGRATATGWEQGKNKAASADSVMELLPALAATISILTETC
ncbi:hypothetical protein [Botryobacter ruber]|uniref:hypothetical protein n=1 Tax=Botryobacter ruber TaxID=2171629 RepID=UPI000F648718|nr:hypothetical protein [Botryobacter ruber]